MSKEEKVSAARKQLEYYFSAENLRKDTYLTSQMDAQKSVAIGVVMKFAKMKVLIEKDAEILREAVKASNVISLSDDGDRIKCLLKDVAGAGGGSNRNTIILREMPSDATEEEIKEVFAFEGCPAIVKVRADVGDCWFVEMESEDAAKGALSNVKKMKLRGEAVKARLKTDATVRSYYSQPSTSMAQAQPGGLMGNMPRGAPPGAVVGGGFLPFPGYNPHGGYMMSGFPPGTPLPQGYPGAGVNHMGVMGEPIGGGTGGGPVPMAIMAPMNGGYNMQVGGGPRGHKHNKYYNGSEANGDDVGQGSGGGKRDRGGTSGSLHDRNGPGNNGNSGNNTSSGAYVRGGPGNTNNANSKADGRGKGKSGQGAGSSRSEGRSGGGKGGGRGGSNSNSGSQSGSGGGGYVVNDSAFPALGAVSQNDAPIPTPGFDGAFKKYSHDQIVEVVSRIKEVQTPVGLDGAELDPSVHGFVLASEPNTQLLMRQRSFTMDETREQLKQGRPVVRDGISVAGATDVDMTTKLEFGDPRSRHGSVDLTHQAASEGGAATPNQGKQLAEEAINASIDGAAAYLANKAKLEKAGAGAGTGGIKVSHKPAIVPSHSTWAALAAKAAATLTDPAPTATKSTSSSPPAASKAVGARSLEGSLSGGLLDKTKDTGSDVKKGAGSAGTGGKDKKRSGRERTKGSSESAASVKVSGTTYLLSACEGAT